MPQVQKEIDRFAAFLGTQGLKLTSERTALVREIFAKAGFFLRRRPVVVIGWRFEWRVIDAQVAIVADGPQIVGEA